MSRRLIICLGTVIFFALTGCATTDVIYSNSREFAWQKIPTKKEAMAACQMYTGQAAAACLFYSKGVCQIISVDTEKNLPLLGEQFKKCFLLYPPTSKTQSFSNTRIVRYYPVKNQEELLAWCGDFRHPFMRGCTEFGRNNLVFITTFAAHLMKEEYILGHELKHAFDGFWHVSNSSKNTPLPWAFSGKDDD